MTQEFEEWYGENHHRFGLGGFKSCHWVWKASREQLTAKLTSDEMVEKCAVSMGEALAKTYPEWAEANVTNFDRVAAKAALEAIVRELCTQ